MVDTYVTDHTSICPVHVYGTAHTNIVKQDKYLEGLSKHWKERTKNF